MATNKMSTYLGFAENQYQTLGGTIPLDFRDSNIQHTAYLAHSRCILPAEMGFALYYEETGAQLKGLPEEVTYVIGVIEALAHVQRSKP